MAAQSPWRLRRYGVHPGARRPGRCAARRSRARGMRLTEANDTARRRDLEIIGEFPALPASPEKPAVVRQATVFRIYPNKAQEEALRQWAGAGRWFWNKCVEINQQLYVYEGRFAFHGELSALLPEMKAAEILAWLKEPPAIHLVDVSRRFDKALRDFLDDRQAVRAGRKTAAKAKDFPKFKSKRDRDVSIYLPGSALKLIRRQAAAPDKARGWVELPGMDETQVWTRVKRQGRIEEKRVNVRRAIRVRGGRWPEGTIRSATIKREGGAWFLSVQFDGPPPKKIERPSLPAPADKPVHPDPTANNGPAVDPNAGPETAAVGYDAGLKNLLIGSDGSWKPVGWNLRKAEKKLKREQRAASRRTQRRLEMEKREGRKLPKSSGERKAHARVAATHRQVRRRRSDLLHQTSHRATAKAGIVCVEDLNVAGMARNKHLAKSVADAGLGEVQRQLEYKSRWRGRHFVKLDRFDASTQTCSGCGHRLEGETKLSLFDRRWTCPSCGEAHDRDENASLNVLRWGLHKLIRRGTSEVTPGKSGALAAGPNPSGKRRKGKGLRRTRSRREAANSARGTGNVGASQDLVSRELLQ
ncbi:RNA-guided endonuclease InsQ/TnpB family protein [Rhodovibrio sodomensis]|nr:RNA-guided endonuclease TnpB family protein [Rhodovibrio sodomensis]